MRKLILRNIRIGVKYFHSNLGRCYYTEECQRKQAAEPFAGRVYLKFNDPNYDGDYIRLVNIELVYE